MPKEAKIGKTCQNPRCGKKIASRSSECPFCETMQLPKKIGDALSSQPKKKSVEEKILAVMSSVPKRPKQIKKEAGTGSVYRPLRGLIKKGLVRKLEGDLYVLDNGSATVETNGLPSAKEQPATIEELLTEKKKLRARLDAIDAEVKAKLKEIQIQIDELK
ncbi:MAG: hypothetical protein AB7K24_04235 [Gemmataceae bacterium]